MFSGSSRRDRTSKPSDTNAQPCCRLGTTPSRGRRRVGSSISRQSRLGGVWFPVAKETGASPSWVGHVSPETTKLYNHLNLVDSKQRMESLEIRF